MKGEIRPDHMAMNKFEFRVLGFITLTVLTISGIEEELETVDLPDRTVVSGGQRKAGDFTIEIPMHHQLEIAAMEVWYKESQDPILPTYKKPVTLVYKSVSGRAQTNYTLVGVFVKKRELPELSKKNEGEMAMIKYTMSRDDIIPL